MGLLIITENAELNLAAAPNYSGNKRNGDEISA